MALRDRGTRAGYLDPVIIADVDDGVIVPVVVEDDNTPAKAVMLQDPDDATRLNEFDPMFKAPISIDIGHHELHEGDSFYTTFVDETMGDNDTIILAWKTPAGAKLAHMITSFSTLVGGDLQLWEGVTWTTNTGVVEPIVNRRRDGTLKSSALLEDKTATPTFTATDNVLSNVTGLNTGAAISLEHTHTWGIRNRVQGGGSRGTQEWILRPDTQYALVFTADGASNKAEVFIDWYEHTSA